MGGPKPRFRTAMVRLPCRRRGGRVRLPACRFPRSSSVPPGIRKGPPVTRQRSAGRVLARQVVCSLTPDAKKGNPKAAPTPSPRSMSLRPARVLSTQSAGAQHMAPTTMATWHARVATPTRPPEPMASSAPGEPVIRPSKRDGGDERWGDDGARPGAEVGEAPPCRPPRARAVTTGLAHRGGRSLAFSPGLVLVTDSKCNSVTRRTGWPYGSVVIGSAITTPSSALRETCAIGGRLMLERNGVRVSAAETGTAPGGTGCSAFACPGNEAIALGPVGASALLVSEAVAPVSGGVDRQSPGLRRCSCGLPI